MQGTDPLMTAAIAAFVTALLFLILYVGKSRRAKYLELETRLPYYAVAMRAGEIPGDHTGRAVSMGSHSWRDHLLTTLGRASRFEEVSTPATTIFGDVSKVKPLKTLERSISSLRDRNTLQHPTS